MKNVSNSEFYNDGYRDGINGVDYSPPDIPVLASEYSDGFYDACKSLEPFPTYEGSNDAIKEPISV